MKRKAGIAIFGDYLTLRAIHDIVHDVNEKSPVIANKDGAFLGLAYDIRKAYEGMRETSSENKHYPEIGPRFGVKVVWPVLLYQVAMLRASLAFIPSTNKHQAATYMLEDVMALS